jgi:hypothetical protein
MILSKTNVLNVVNSTLAGKKTGKNKFDINDLFIYSYDDTKHFRLTTLGRDALSKVFQSYTIPLTTKLPRTSGRQILMLDKYMVSPYFLSPVNKLIVFEEIVASEFLMLDANFDDWVEIKSFYEK